MVSFLHGSDFHLSASFAHSSLREISIKRRNDIWRSVESLFNLAKEQKVDFLFLTGDLYNEEYFTLSDMKRLIDLFCLVPETKIIVTPGNHDPYRKESLWTTVEIPDHVHIFKTEKIEKLEFPEVDIYGIAFENQHFKKDHLFDGLVLDEKKINILAIHGDVFDVESPYMPLDRQELNQYPFDYIALGHIHKPLSVNERTMYSGSIEPLDFGETGKHGVIYGEIEQGVLKVDRIALSKSRFVLHEHRIQDEFNYYDLEKQLRKLKGNYEGNLYLRLILEGSLSKEYGLDLDALKDHISPLFEYVEIVDNIHQEYDIDKIYELNRSNLIGLFIEEIRSRNEDAISKIALQIGLEALIEHGEK